jgi:aminoglycoside phosphotransferase (APT) family kinase protein
MATLHADVVEVKSAIKEVASALTKLALVEERQTHHAASQERAFTMLDKIERRMGEHERRIVELEKSEPAQTRTAEWVDRAVWAAAAAACAALAAKVGLIG